MSRVQNPLHMALLNCGFSELCPQTLGIWPGKWGENLSPQEPTAEDTSFSYLPPSQPNLRYLCIRDREVGRKPCLDSCLFPSLFAKPRAYAFQS